MATKKYPIGTKIRFIFDNVDKDKIGKIVGERVGNPLVNLDNACKKKPFVWKGIEYTWWCGWEQIEPLLQKNQQLLFAFMEQENGRYDIEF